MSWQPKSLVPPPGYSYGPRYRPSWFHVLEGAVFILLGRPRSLARDALRAMTDAPLPPLIRGQDRVPETGGFVVAANHYERPGLWMAWPALLVSQLVQARTGGDVHWVVIQEWESLSVMGIPVPRAAVRMTFERAFRVYGLHAMAPPYATASARAASMRAMAEAVRRGQVIGLMPEGDAGPTPELLEPREGVGAFLLLLRAPIIPVGLYEEGGRLVAEVGAQFELHPPEAIDRADRDRWARDQVMCAIRNLLPQPLWGVYRPE